MIEGWGGCERANIGIDERAGIKVAMLNLCFRYLVKAT